MAEDINNRPHLQFSQIACDRIKKNCSRTKLGNRKEVSTEDYWSSRWQTSEYFCTSRDLTGLILVQTKTLVEKNIRKTDCYCLFQFQCEDAGIMAVAVKQERRLLKKESVKRRPFAGNHRRRAANLKLWAQNTWQQK